MPPIAGKQRAVGGDGGGEGGEGMRGRGRGNGIEWWTKTIEPCIEQPTNRNHARLAIFKSWIVLSPQCLFVQDSKHTNRTSFTILFWTVLALPEFIEAQRCETRLMYSAKTWELKRYTQSQRDYRIPRVPEFLSLRRNWVPPLSTPQANVAPPRTQVMGATLAGGWGVGGPIIPTTGQRPVVYFVYAALTRELNLFGKNFDMQREKFVFF